MKKLTLGVGLKELELRPIVHKTEMATYNRAKYLATAILNHTLKKFDYLIINTPDFISHLKEKKLPKEM